MSGGGGGGPPITIARATRGPCGGPDGSYDFRYTTNSDNFSGRGSCPPVPHAHHYQTQNQHPLGGGEHYHHDHQHGQCNSPHQYESVKVTTTSSKPSDFQFCLEDESNDF